jgi:hypothetical protein
LQELVQEILADEVDDAADTNKGVQLVAFVVDSVYLDAEVSVNLFARVSHTEKVFIL